MRLLVISSSFPPITSPESSHTFHLCDRLAGREPDLHLITSAGPDRPGPYPFAVHSVMPDWRWHSLPVLLRSIRRIRPDAILLIHLGWIYDHQPMVSFLPSFARLAAPRARFVTQFENIQAEESRWVRLFRKAYRFLPRPLRPDLHLGTLLTGSDRLIALSERHIDELERRRPGVRRKTALIPAPPIMKVLDDPDGTHRAQGRERLGVRDGEILLAFFGFIYQSKGIETLFEALARLPPDLPPVKLVLIGQVAEPTYGAMLHDLAGRLGVLDRVIWVGHCDPEADDASIFMRAADVGIFPFDIGIRLNNSSFAVAASHGLPLITTAGADLESQFVDRDNVWLCPPQDPAALAEAIAALAADPETRRELGAGSLRLVAECFSWDKVIDATLAQLRSR